MIFKAKFLCFNIWTAKRDSPWCQQILPLWECEFPFISVSRSSDAVPGLFLPRLGLHIKTLFTLSVWGPTGSDLIMTGNCTGRHGTGIIALEGEGSRTLHYRAIANLFVILIAFLRIEPTTLYPRTSSTITLVFVSPYIEKDWEDECKSQQLESYNFELLTENKRLISREIKRKF